MAYSRYDNRAVFVNSSEGYRKAFFKKRAVYQIKQYGSPDLPRPLPSMMQELNNIPLVWAADSRLFKLADEFYGDPTYWWIIAWFNQKPTEGHFNIGDVFYVPTPLDRVLEYF